MAPLHNCTLRIWTECTRTVQKIRRFPIAFHTPSSAIKAEEDLHRQLIQILNIFPKTTIHRITKTSPPTITAIFTHTRITPHQLLHLHNTYSPPPEIATLRINNETVTCNVLHNLRNAYSTQQYRTYLQAKTEWSDTTTDTIDWALFTRAFTPLKGNQKKIITIHPQMAPHKCSPLSRENRNGTTVSTLQQGGRNLYTLYPLPRRSRTMARRPTKCNPPPKHTHKPCLNHTLPHCPTPPSNNRI
jgi:hypothetical protein